MDMHSHFFVLILRQRPWRVDNLIGYRHHADIVEKGSIINLLPVQAAHAHPLGKALRNTHAGHRIDDCGFPAEPLAVHQHFQILLLIVVIKNQIADNVVQFFFILSFPHLCEHVKIVNRFLEQPERFPADHLFRLLVKHGKLKFIAQSHGINVNLLSQI